MKPFAMALTATLLAAACSALPVEQDRPPAARGAAPPVDKQFAVDTTNGTPVDVRAYNRMIAAQGHAHYCGTGQCDSLPQLISGYAPRYPRELISSGVTGHASIVFTIDEHGSVVDPRVESATRPEFADASLHAIRSWRFKPATLKGEPVRLISRQQFPFELR